MTDETQDAAGGWFGPETATLGDRIAGARDAAGLSQTDLARRIGVRLATLVAWEEDQSDPRSNRLQMLAGVLGVSLRWLLTGDGEGVEAPVADPDLAADARALLTEMRQMRGDLLRLADRLGTLEKRARSLVKETL
jgi:transcriptional regulator with XRE-family HTH domain